MSDEARRDPAKPVSANDILDDARRIAAFGLRSGKLTDDALLKAIGATEASLAAGSGGREQVPVEKLTALAKEMATAQAVIQPMTLMDLRANDPYEDGRHMRQRAYTYSLSLLASALLVLISALLVWQDRASQVMAVYARNLPAQFEAIVTELVTMTERFEDKGELRAITALELSAIGARIQDATEIVQEINANATLAAALDEGFLTTQMLKQTLFGLYKPSYAIGGDFTMLDNTVAKPPTGGASVAAAAVGTPPPPPAVEAAAKSPPPVITTPCDDTGIDPAVVKAAVGSPPPRDNASARGLAASVTLYYRYRSMIECVAGLTDQRRALPDNAKFWSGSDLLGQLKTKLMVVNALLLPAAFGFLGAIIYHFRVFMDPLRPDVPLQRVLLRIFLGGFAGLTTYFFFTTDARIAAGLSPTLAGLAVPFLLGFSIDVFFRLLDRLVQQMNRWVDGIGEPTKGATGTGG